MKICLLSHDWPRSPIFVRDKKVLDYWPQYLYVVVAINTLTINRDSPLAIHFTVQLEATMNPK